MASLAIPFCVFGLLTVTFAGSPLEYITRKCGETMEMFSPSLALSLCKDTSTSVCEVKVTAMGNNKLMVKLLDSNVGHKEVKTWISVRDGESGEDLLPEAFTYESSSLVTSAHSLVLRVDFDSAAYRAEAAKQRPKWVILVTQFQSDMTRESCEGKGHHNRRRRSVGGRFRSLVGVGHQSFLHRAKRGGRYYEKNDEEELVSEGHQRRGHGGEQRDDDQHGNYHKKHHGAEKNQDDDKPEWKHHKVHCDVHRCLDPVLHCDGDINCDDGSDETKCHKWRGTGKLCVVLGGSVVAVAIMCIFAYFIWRKKHRKPEGSDDEDSTEEKSEVVDGVNAEKPPIDPLFCVDASAPGDQPIPAIGAWMENLPMENPPEYPSDEKDPAMIGGDAAPGGDELPSTPPPEYRSHPASVKDLPIV